MTLPPSPSELVQAFAALAQRARGAAELLAGAAEVLGAALPFFQRLLMLDCAGVPPVVREAAGTGWADPELYPLGEALLSLPCFCAWTRSRSGEGPPMGLKMGALAGNDLEALNAVFASAGQAEPAVAAFALWYPLRGHGLAVLLASSHPVPALTEQERSCLSAVLAILGTAFGFALRKRHYARRLKQIRRAKIAWQGTVDALPQIVCVLDPDGIVTRVNRAVEAWGLGPVTSPSFGTLHELLHPGCTAPECGLADRLSLALSGYPGAEAREFEFADRVLERVLRVKIGCAKGSKLNDSARRYPPGFALVEDLTPEQLARRRALRENLSLRCSLEQRSEALNLAQMHLESSNSKLADTQAELEETQRRHRLVLENTNAGLLMVAGGRIVYCNTRFEDLLGYAKGELAGARITDLLPPGCLGIRVVLSPDGEPVRSRERVCEARRRDGASLWLRISEVGFVAQREQIRFITATNVTEQVFAEQQILTSRQELQRLSRSLISAQEEERKRVAGDLHDGIGQELSVLKLMLQDLATSFDAAGDGRRVRQLQDAVDKTQGMIQEVRRVSMALRPAILDSGGLLLALTRLCREVRALKDGPAVHLETGNQESDIPEALKIHLFRIVQEALNNVIKHAGARNVWVRLQCSDKGLLLEVEDDGVGFDPADMETLSRGLGLSSIKQRAGLDQGVLKLTSEPGRGTTLCALWGGDGPLP